MNVLKIVKAAEKHKMGVGPQLFRLPQEGQAVQVWHTNVGQHHVHLVVPQDGQGMGAGEGLQHNQLVPVLLLHLAGKPFHNVRFVIYQQKSLHVVTLPPLGSAAG